MTTLTIHSASRVLIKPEPRSPITIRPAMMPPQGGADVMFIDQLQKLHSKAVGFMPMSQIEKRIAGGQNGKVLIAQDPQTTQRVGYIIFADKYFKREDLGIVYQLNIAPHKQRGLVGAALVKAAFEACPRGVKLFCCWCAQDLAANHFWESMGFVPLAFRAGSRGKAQGGKRKEGRMQILWQRRIREGDGETPYWYPTETTGGAMKENRIVLPIPPDKHWSDELPFVLPGVSAGAVALQLESESEKPAKPRTRKSKPVAESQEQRKRGLWFEAAAPAASPPQAEEAVEAEPAPRKPRRRNDPKLVAAAREIRDRYLDEVNTARLLPAAWQGGKYDISRQLAAAGGGRRLGTGGGSMPLLNAA